MSAQPLGIALDLATKREAVASRLSPAARHQAFPTVYARPVPPPADRKNLQAKIRKLEGQLDEAKVTIQKLTADNETLRRIIESPRVESTARRCASAKDVMTAFCESLNRNGFRVDEELWTLEHMQCARRSRILARPRQVCMWTVVQICRHLSLPMIGHAFGGRDHTTVMHGRNGAAEIMREMPALAIVAREVIDQFSSAEAP